LQVLTTFCEYFVHYKFLKSKQECSINKAYRAATPFEVSNSGGLELILFDHRINFETPNGKGEGSWFATAWFTNGLKIGKELTFVVKESAKKISCRLKCKY